MDIKNVAVIGAGIMGSGIAQVASTYGYDVNLMDIDENILNKAKNDIKANLERFFVGKNKISQEDAEKILDRIKITTNRDKAIEKCQLVIEAVFEDLDLKKKIFEDLDSKCEKNVILASNTSSLSINQIASNSKHQDRIVGIHFFNPAPVMKLIELIKGKNSSEKIVKNAKEFSESLNKTVVIVNDAPGFVTTRLIYVLCNEAINMKMKGIASTKDIDIACKLAFNFPMGPLELSDLIGLDTYDHVGDYLYEEFGDKYKPSPLLKDMVKNNLLGRKTQKGFYEY